jgi:hypothetical protein
VTPKSNFNTPDAPEVTPLAIALRLQASSSLKMMCVKINILMF